MSIVLLTVSTIAALLVVMLVIVGVARGLDRKPQGSVPSPVPDLATVFGRRKEDTASAKDGSAADDNKKQTRTAMGVIASIVAVMGVVAFAKEFNDGNIAPQISDIAAGELHGTMINARNSDPVVLIVPGSGPTDRDGNGPIGLKTDAYKLLAEALSEERISTVRIDKRGMFGSVSAGNPNDVSPEIYAADIHAWIDRIKEVRGSDCVFLMGHSEGALMVSIAAQGRNDVCGLILVAGMGRPMGQVIREQLRANPANTPILDQAMGALSELEAGRKVDTATLHPALNSLFAPQVQNYLISVIDVDPVEELRKAKRDALIVQGDRDIQVSVEDARLLDSAPKTKLRVIKGMNHVLKAAPEDRASNLATYADPSLPLADDLVRRIRDFVEDND